jgi:hypothetical protein
MDPVVVALAGLALVLVIGLAFFWQEVRSIPEDARLYSMRDAVDFVWDRLDEEARGRLTKADVRRILEWETRFHQEVMSRDGEANVVGGEEGAAFVQQQGIAAGYAYDGPVIMEVLAHEVEYLRAIGAVGDPVEGDTS